jgi:hypothetical protein
MDSNNTSLLSPLLSIAKELRTCGTRTEATRSPFAARRIVRSGIFGGCARRCSSRCIACTDLFFGCARKYSSRRMPCTRTFGGCACRCSSRRIACTRFLCGCARRCSTRRIACNGFFCGCARRSSTRRIACTDFFFGCARRCSCFPPHLSSGLQPHLPHRATPVMPPRPPQYRTRRERDVSHPLSHFHPPRCRLAVYTRMRRMQTVSQPALLGLFFLVLRQRQRMMHCFERALQQQNLALCIHQQMCCHNWSHLHCG